MDGSDWRAQFSAESRKKILGRIMQVLKTMVPSNGEEGLLKIVEKFERKTYNAATSLEDYLKMISSKLLKLESRHSTPDSGKTTQSGIQDTLRSRPVVVSCPSELISTEVLIANFARAAESSKFQDSQRPSTDQNRVPNLVGQRGKPLNVVSRSRKRQHQNPHFQDQSMKHQSPEIQNQGVSQVQPVQQGFQKQLSSQNPRTHNLYQQHQGMFQMERQSHMRQQRQTTMEPSAMQPATISSLQQNQQHFSLRSQSIPREHQQQWGSQQNQHFLPSGLIIPQGGQQLVFWENHAQSSLQSESTVMEQQPQLVYQQQQRHQQWVSGSDEQRTVPQQQLMIVRQANAMNIQPNQMIAQGICIPGVQQHRARLMGQQSNMLNSSQHSPRGNMTNTQQHGACVIESRAVSRESTDNVEGPHARLIKAMLSIPHKNLAAAVGDIFSAIREADRIPEYAPGTESEAIFSGIL